MKRPLLILLIFCGLIIVLWVVGRATGMLQFYNIPAGNMEPSMRVGQKFLSTNLKKPKRNDIIVYKRTVNELSENDINGTPMRFCSRLVATEGDTLQIINGYIHVNEKAVDDTNNLKFMYTLLNSDFEKLLTILDVKTETPDFQSNFSQYGDSSYANLTGKQYKQLKDIFPLNRYILNSSRPPLEIYPNNQWTIDNFGPYKIPLGTFFVLGDNRHNSLDSRFTGPIPIKDVKGVVIRKL